MGTRRVHLPVVVERSIQEVSVLKLDLANKFEREAHVDVAQKGRVITCQAGCASCCYHPILITILEAIPIYRWLADNGRWTSTLKSRLEETAESQYGTPYEVWVLSLIPCSFLDENNHCSIYEVRPFICRTYYAVSDPYFCHPHRLGPETELVSRSEVSDKYHAEQEKLLQKQQVHFSGLPIGLALLMAERVCNGELDLRDIDAEVLNEYQEKG